MVEHTKRYLQPWIQSKSLASSCLPEDEAAWQDVAGQRNIHNMYCTTCNENFGRTSANAGVEASWIADAETFSTHVTMRRCSVATACKRCGCRVRRRSSAWTLVSWFRNISKSTGQRKIVLDRTKCPTSGYQTVSLPSLVTWTFGWHGITNDIAASVPLRTCARV